MLHIRFVLVVISTLAENELPVVLFYQLSHQGGKGLMYQAFAEYHQGLVQCVFV